MSFTKKQLLTLVAVVFGAALFLGADTAAAQTEGEAMEAAAFIGAEGLTGIGKGIGLGLIILGAGKGIGMIGSHAVDATARQPEAAGNIFQSSIILAALIEGATLFAIVAVSFFF